jgi:hypothetical protein
MDFIERMIALQNGLNHGISKENLRKFQMKLKLWQFFWIKFFKYFLISLVIPSFATMLLIMYIRQDYNIYLIKLLLIFVMASFIMVEVISTITLSTLLIYATTLFLRMRFQQITKQFEGISAKNLNSLQSLIREHNRITVMTKDMDIFFSKIFAIFYFYAPLVINLLLCISIYGKSSIYWRSFYSIFAIFMSIGTYLLSYIPTQVSTEAHRCYNTIVNAKTFQAFTDVLN